MLLRDYAYDIVFGIGAVIFGCPDISPDVAGEKGGGMFRILPDFPGSEFLAFGFLYHSGKKSFSRNPVRVEMITVSG